MKKKEKGLYTLLQNELQYMFKWNEKDKEESVFKMTPKEWWRDSIKDIPIPTVKQRKEGNFV